MKKIVRMLAIVLVMLFSGSHAFSQIVVNIRPPRPQRVIVRPAHAPSPRHVWVEEDWRPHGRGYVWHGGYWTVPPHRRAAYFPGHWRNTRRGSVWVPGRWR